MARATLSGLNSLIVAWVLLHPQALLASELPVSEILQRSLAAEQANYFREIRTLQLMAHGPMDDPQQSYELIRTTKGLPSEPRLDHVLVDFENRRLRHYYHRLQLCEIDLRFEELAIEEETSRITTDMREFERIPRSFEQNLDSLLMLPGYAVFRALEQAEADPILASKTIEIEESTYRIPVDGFDGLTRNLFIDARTFIVQRLDWDSPDVMTGTRTNSYKYFGRSDATGVYAPQQVETIRNGHVTLTQDLVSVKLNGDIPDSVFEHDEDLVELTTEDLTLRLEWLADKVGRVKGPILDLYSLNFIELEDGILVYDAPFPEGVQEDALALISEATGGKKVNYAVISHHHGDHVRGIRAYWKLGVNIITSRATLPMVLAFQYQRTLDSILEQKIDLESLSPKITLVAPDTSVNVGGEGSDIRVFNLGRTPHVNDLLTLYLPEQDMVFQADGYFLFSRFNRSFEHFLSWVQSNFDNPTIVGVHSAVGTLDELLKRRGTQTSFVPKYLEELDLAAE